MLDPKVHHADYYKPITLITPNLKEAEMLTDMAIENEQLFQAAGQKLLERFDCLQYMIAKLRELFMISVKGQKIK